MRSQDGALSSVDGPPSIGMERTSVPYTLGTEPAM